MESCIHLEVIGRFIFSDLILLYVVRTKHDILPFDMASLWYQMTLNTEKPLYLVSPLI